MPPRLSIIIPTYRRPFTLLECLKRIEQQTVASEIEVIVVSDGHDDKTARLFVKQEVQAISDPTSPRLRGAGQRSAISSEWKVPARYFEISKSQQGVARNEGVKHAQGEYVLFIGDDTFLEPDACEKHLKAHHPHPAHSVRTPPPAAPQSPGEGLGEGAVLGFTTWDPTVHITPVMRWLEKSGWQFGYPKISQYSGQMIPEKIQHQFTYTIHISLPLSVAQKLPFRTDVHLYGWEDIEWGMRLKKAGVRLFYEPNAKALHHHHLTLEDSLKRMEILGRSAVEFQKMIPGFDRVPTGWKLLAYKIAALFPSMAGRHRRAFLTGILGNVI
ncbi:MAG: glycosyltransferase [Candidatus Peribacteraceae bacterium]|nr:glycosyltransferase [Candidatus Peribacteraceae bacterium]